MATELEFYILRPRERGDDPPVPPPRTPTAQNYDLEVVSRQEAILTEILATCAAQGLETDTLIAEYGPGQFEVNFHHTDDVLRAAETAILFRRLVRGIVARHGMEATFMAKPYAEAPGNGMHVHCSVLDAAGRNIFAPEGQGNIFADQHGAGRAGAPAETGGGGRARHDGRFPGDLRAAHEFLPPVPADELRALQPRLGL